MKNRKIIEMLSKQNWDAEVQINVGLPTHTGDKIRSISSFTHKQKAIITINSFDITPNKKLYVK